jgi:hypothetical protein
MCGEIFPPLSGIFSESSKLMQFTMYAGWYRFACLAKGRQCQVLAPLPRVKPTEDPPPAPIITTYVCINIGRQSLIQ